jgi:DNA-directed RNA polymerase subunit K/omega
MIVDEATDIDQTTETPAAPVKVPPIESRFLFVDVAALRAKQLRRGALPRLPAQKEEATEVRPDVPRKAERIAMEEVRLGLVSYELPGQVPPSPEGQS